MTPPERPAQPVSPGADGGLAPPDPAILQANLRAIAGLAPATARLIARTPAREDVAFAATDEGPLTATAGGRRLSSARRPRTEATRFAEGVDVRAGAVLAVSGFGLGHHLAALSERVGRYGLLAVFEPDVALLRAVLERIDCSGWMSRTPTILVTDAEDASALSAGLTSFQALAAMGVKLVDDHPPSRTRLGQAAIDRFGRSVTDVVRAVRTTITTTLVQVETTLRNVMMNLDRYATRPGIAELAGAARGTPAVLVAAGPSLERNIDLLARSGVRDRVVIIAAQTVLRPLLARGIRPHYVTALDHHEISSRFYEGLTAADVEGVTLVAEPMANPAILDAFPGEIRLTRDERLDTLLGPELTRDMGCLPGAATVAHLSYLLARHLGCDPAILIGQDLGFTDGQYYASGAAIHDVWAGELNPFRTLEMFEHERIVRMRHLLIPAEDQFGRSIYTDEQMHTYLVQFEELFRADADAGLRTIDATEGGVAKAATEVMPLVRALEEAGADRGRAHTGDAPSVTARLTRATSTAHTPEPEGAIAAARERLTTAREQTTRMSTICARTLEKLERMQRHHEDTDRVNRLIGEVQELRDEVSALEPGYRLVQHLNQTGTLKRLRTDREIALEPDLEPRERQSRQIQRDVTNVSWLRDAARHLDAMLDQATHALDTGEKATRDTPAPESAIEGTPAAGDAGTAAEGAGALSGARARCRRVLAIIPVDPDRSSLGTPRDLAEPIASGRDALSMTLERLARCRHLDGVALVTDQPERVRALAGDAPGVTVLARDRLGAGSDDRGLGAMVRAARAFAPACWRGAIGGLTVYDELFEPGLHAEAMAALGADAAAIVGPDWAMVDPGLVDETIACHLEDPDQRTLTFSQAAPGLGACVIARELVEDLRAQISRAGHLASVGGAVGYHPSCARADPIARPACVKIPPPVRDLPMRAIADTPARRRIIGEALAAAGPEAPCERVAQALAALAPGEHADAPHHLVLELCTGRLTAGVRAGWLRSFADAPERGPMPIERARAVIEPLARARPDLVLTLAGEGDPLHHPEWAGIVRMAREAGAASVHVRTDLLVEPEAVDRLAACGADVVSVDLLADSRETYRALTGVDRFEAARSNVERLIECARTGGRFGPPWAVPRMTRCDAVYEEVEAFYDRWLSRCGACAIDPLPMARVGERIAPLPVPERAARAERVSTLRVDADAGVRMAGVETPLRSAAEEPIESVWRSVRRAGAAMRSGDAGGVLAEPKQVPGEPAARLLAPGAGADEEQGEDEKARVA